VTRFRPTDSAAAAVLLAAALLSACGRSEPPATTATAASPASEPAAAKPEADRHLPAGIDWFEGDVDAAFAAAESASRPLFLYWGAEWCPPCAQIKATIFNRREFQERARLFVPVYLDGDTPSAQKQGERFGVIGYPTMILFRPDGTEITRLPGGVDVQRYATILDVALADARPVTEILRAASTGGELSAGDWRLLAYYSWSTDNGRVLPEDASISTLRSLSERCPVELRADCSRLFFDYLFAASAADPSPLTGLDRASARRTLTDLLGEPAVQRANVSNLSYGAKSIVPLLCDEGSAERRELIASWSSALDSLEADPAGAGLSNAERLNLLRAHVVLQQLAAPGDPLPEELLARMRATVAEIDRTTTDAYARQAGINAAANLYWEAGLDEEANRLLVAELEKSKQPYYFMSSLGELAQKAGREDDAIRWLARAYDEAQGPATRFQWGYNYMVGLLEMSPEDTDTIERTGLQLIGELGASPDAFYQRTRIRLEALDGKLRDWSKDSEERARVIETLRARTEQICKGLPESEQSRSNCERFLNPAVPATQEA
jgi:thiol-disulfide isomerase/thioredoxin